MSKSILTDLISVGLISHIQIRKLNIFQTYDDELGNSCSVKSPFAIFSDVIIVSVGRIKSRISIWIIRQLQDHFVSVSGFMDQKKRYLLLMLNPILNPFCLFKNILRNLGHVLKVSSKCFIGEKCLLRKGCT